MARSGRRWRVPEAGGFLCVRSRAIARCPLSSPPAAPLKPSVGRSLNPSVVRPCAWHAGSTAAWGPDRAAVAWGASCRLRWAGAVGCVGRGGQDLVRLPVSPRPRAHGRWAPARRPAAYLAAQPRSQQTPLARPQTWAFFRAPSRAVARRGLRTLPAALLKLALGCPQPVQPRRTAGQPGIPGSRAYRAVYCFLSS